MSYQLQAKEVASLFMRGQFEEAITAYADLRYVAITGELIVAKSWEDTLKAQGKMAEAGKFLDIIGYVRALQEEAAQASQPK